MSRQQTTDTLPPPIIQLIGTRRWSAPAAVFQTESRHRGLVYSAAGLAAAVLGVGTLFLLNTLDWGMRSLRLMAVLAIIGGIGWAIYSIVHAVIRRTRTISVHAEGLVYHDGKAVTAVAWDDVAELLVFDLTMFDETSPAMFHLIDASGSPLKADGDIKGFQELFRMTEEQVVRRNRKVTRKPMLKKPGE